MPRGTRWTSATEDELQQAEAFRLIRSSVEVVLPELARASIMVTSARAGEGKTTTAARMAVSLANAGRRVVAVDFDLRHPDLHNRLGGYNDRGTTDVLLERRSLTDSLQQIKTSGVAGPTALYLLAAGSPVENPTELLGTVRTRRLLDRLTEEADVVVVDAPPVLPVADTLVIGRLVGGAILVAEARQALFPQLKRSQEALGRNGIRVIGTVLNKMRSKDASYEYGYGYGYGYGDTEPVDRGGQPEEQGNGAG